MVADFLCFFQHSADAMTVSQTASCVCFSMRVFDEHIVIRLYWLWNGEPRVTGAVRAVPSTRCTARAGCCRPAR